MSKPEEDAPQVGQRFKPSTERCPNPRFLDDGTNIKRVETVEDRDERIAYERKEGIKREHRA